MKRVLILGAALVLPVFLTACGGSSKPAPEPVAEEMQPISPPPLTVTRPTDIPLPPRHTLDLERTVMVGSESEWLGRASMSVPIEPIGVWDFYRREMPRQGWTEISASQSPNRVLFYQRGNRVAVIEMHAGRNNSRVDIWMNPRQAAPPVAEAPVAPPVEPESNPPEAPRSDTIDDMPLPPLPWQQ